ncbi:aldose 1-epimerase [Flagellimonas nanhaiensis]|uniref:Aldose 1-epimerase n=1 Tax=Flagellimonas nanhaiensis TaxID=2292706 RepID=A0A371JP61_9FLAO|nr:hypothetical protein [Allomuricauda nanhaiensis]RDY59295.1 hypothetical protein DX873_07815 [Allomuricauda nanhaiensis]
MKFEVLKKSCEGLELLEIKNTISGEYINIVPHYGGAINEVVLKKGEKLYSVHKSAKNLKEFEEVSIPLYSGTFLAPFPNRIKNGHYRFDGIDYQLELSDVGLPNAIHGFMYKHPFTLQSFNKNTGEVVMEAEFTGDKGYPFKLNFTNTYKLEEGRLSVKSSVKNVNGKNIPFGMGWHPYISTGTDIDLMKLRIPGTSMFEQDKNSIPTGNILENSKFQDFNDISTQSMDDCYKLEGNSTHLLDPVKDLEIIIEQQMGNKAFNYGMYFIPSSRDCIAIEPMTLPPNGFNSVNGLATLKTDETIEAQFSIKLV